MITILTGDMVSSGDALIVDRGLKLLKYFHPSEEILKLNRWESLEKNLDRVNNTKVLILLGGPAIAYDLYPNIYPLVKDLKTIKVPIITLGLGSGFLPYNSKVEDKIIFSDKSKELLKRIQNDYKWFSVRDYVTERLLKKNGVQNIYVTGCPAWFDIENLGLEIKYQKIEVIAFAAGVGHFLTKNSFEQQVNVLSLLRNKFPTAKKYCVFQDSLENDENKRNDQRKLQRKLANIAEVLGFKEVNCGYNLKNMIDVYKESDLLITYRVHSHVCMLTMGKPSILIAEDSRGYGFSDFIGIKNFNSFLNEQSLLNYDFYYPSNLMIKILRRLRMFPTKTSRDLYKELDMFIDQQLDNNFLLYQNVHKVILEYFKKMEMYVKNIPL